MIDISIANLLFVGYLKDNIIQCIYNFDNTN